MADVTPLRGELVRLRARIEADVRILDEELHDDVVTAARGTQRPWRPMTPGHSSSHHRVKEPSAEAASFSVVELATDTLAGTAGLWGIDAHNRSAHLGLGLRPAFRGKGLGTDIVRVLCHYGFVVLGLHRLQIDTLADNHAMLAAAERVGFRRETVHRQSAWVLGEFLDEVVLGLLAREHDARS
ncbi:MAG TPA: GNAT family protein [Pseudonocardiaceae bacterium]|nr:GNAT family protein [Pseudonocardiaceae bacterium]